MKILKIEGQKLDIKLSFPFSYSTLTLHYLPYLLITIETDQKIKGFGEVALAWDITGETQKGAFQILELIKPFLLKKPINSLKDVKKIMHQINKNIFGNSALKAGIEMALLDLVGKFKRKPVYQLLKGRKKKYIFIQKILSFEEQNSGKLEKIIKRALEQKVRFFKFKVGKESKIEKLIEKILKIFPNLQIILDANQAWEEAKMAISIIKKLEKFKNILWIEQPIFWKDYQGLAEIRRKTKIPIMVDESCHNLLDLENLYFRKALDLVNIKLAKAGGIFEALKMIEFCEKHNIKYILGDMLHSSLGTAANLHFATLGNFLSYELTLPTRIKKDPFEGLKFEGFKAYIPQVPGLGVSPKREK